MALVLENSWAEEESAFEKLTIIFVPQPQVQEPVLLGLEKNVIPNSQISTCSRKDMTLL